MNDRAQQTNRGIMYLLGAIVIFSLQDVIIKFISDDFAVHQVFFLRCLLALPLVVIIARFTDGVTALRAHNYHAQFWRALCIFFAYILRKYNENSVLYYCYWNGLRKVA